jgi:hypothetical protein
LPKFKYFREFFSTPKLLEAVHFWLILNLEHLNYGFRLL